jgi:hypothetical protein
MYYYVVNKIGTGTIDDPFRPDLDAGTSFVGNVGNDNKFIIATPTQQATKPGRLQLPPIQQLKDACTARGINFDDVLNKWMVK